MSKTYDVDWAQRTADRARASMAGHLYHHYKGGEYKVINVVVDELSGEPVVIYQSLLYGYLWCRPLKVFEEVLPSSRRRFELAD